ncbi:hypothetical protein EVAR_47890_1 [Eumeta japonica]|uniref:Uncharacterized protein n=1 Tax=Eumeta variegata TaxID=151549 RepID=A0A4C1YAJ1_EUMVA|nr:hypothetical protein EVAR_47890_1 [Eumeta japonica]
MSSEPRSDWFNLTRSKKYSARADPAFKPGRSHTYEVFIIRIAAGVSTTGVHYFVYMNSSTDSSTSSLSDRSESKPSYLTAVRPKEARKRKKKPPRSLVHEYANAFAPFSASTEGSDFGWPCVFARMFTCSRVESKLLISRRTQTFELPESIWLPAFIYTPDHKEVTGVLPVSWAGIAYLIKEDWGDERRRGPPGLSLTGRRTQQCRPRLRSLLCPTSLPEKSALSINSLAYAVVRSLGNVAPHSGTTASKVFLRRNTRRYEMQTQTYVVSCARSELLFYWRELREVLERVIEDLKLEEEEEERLGGKTMRCTQ